MTTEAERQAVLRHLDVLKRVGGQPSDLDEFLGLEAGTTERVITQERTANGEGDLRGRRLD